MCIYWDSSSKGQNKHLTHTKYHSCWRVEVTINGKRHRKRFKSLAEAKLHESLLKKQKENEERHKNT